MKKASKLFQQFLHHRGLLSSFKYHQSIIDRRRAINKPYPKSTVRAILLNKKEYEILKKSNKWFEGFEDFGYELKQYPPISDIPTLYFVVFKVK